MLLSGFGYALYNPLSPYDMTENISRHVDLIFPGETHIYHDPARNGLTFDPEGLYGIPNSLVCAILGFVAAKGKSWRLGLSLIILGFAANIIEPMCRPLWSAPVVLLSAGINCLALTFFSRLEKNESARKILHPLAACGFNPLLVYILSELVITFMWLPLGDISFFDNVLYPLVNFFDNTQASATLSAIFFASCFVPLTEFLYRRRIMIKL